MKQINRLNGRMIAAGLAAAMVLGACGGEEDPEAQPADAEATTEGSSDTEDPEGRAGESLESYTFGVIIEETGNASVFGEPTNHGWQVALEELNEQSEVSFSVETCDGASDPQQAITCYERLVDRDGVDAVVGPTISASVIALDPMVREDERLLYYLGGGYGERDMGGNPYMFGANTTTEDVLATIFAWGAAQGYTDTYMISTADATGQDCREFVSEPQYEERRVLELIGQDEMAIDAQSAAPQMANVPTEADMVILCATGGAGVVMAAGFEQAGLEMPAVALHSQGLPAIEKAMEGAVSDGKVYVAGFCPLAAAKDELPDGFACTEATMAFTERLQQMFPDAEPTFISAATYDALTQIGAAVREVGADTDAIVNWFESQEALAGANGIYDYGPDQHRGMGLESVIMGVYRDGGFHLESMLNMPKA